MTSGMAISELDLEFWTPFPLVSPARRYDAVDSARSELRRRRECERGREACQSGCITQGVGRERKKGTKMQTGKVIKFGSNLWNAPFGASESGSLFFISISTEDGGENQVVHLDCQLNYHVPPHEV